MSALPEVRCEIAFQADPTTATPTWTDVSAFLRLSAGVTCHRGRQYELDQVQPGECQLTLLNDDGRFTPGKLSSPYYPYVIPGRRIRLTAIWAGVEYPLFSGTVDTFPAGWPTRFASRNLVTIRATDHLKQLSKHELPSYAEQVTLDLNPIAFYPLGEEAGSDAAGDLTGDNPALTRMRLAEAGLLTFGEDMGMFEEPGADFQPTSSTKSLGSGYDAGDYLQGDLATPVDFDGFWAVSLWLRTDQWTPLGNPVPLTIGASNASKFELRLHTDGRANPFYDAATIGPGVSGPRLGDDAAHHIVVNSDATAGSPGTFMNVYVDGVLTASDTDAAVPAAASATRIMLGRGYFDAGAVGKFYRGKISQVAIWNRNLTAAEVALLHDAGRVGVPAEPSGARAQRITGYTDVAGGTFDPGLSNMGPQPLKGRSASEVLLEVATTEAGVYYLGGAGPRFHDRARRRNAVAAFELDADDGQVGDLDFSADDQLLVNDLGFTGAGGAIGRRTNPASIALFGTYRGRLDLPLVSDFESGERAQGQVDAYGQPRPRTQSIEIDPLANPALFPVALGADLSQRSSTLNLPTNAPSHDADWLIERVEHSFSHESWKTTVQASPYDSTAYFQFDHPIFGRLDAGNVVGW